MRGCYASAAHVATELREIGAKLDALRYSTRTRKPWTARLLKTRGADKDVGVGYRIWLPYKREQP